MVSVTPIFNGIRQVITSSPYLVMGEGQSVFQEALQRSVRGVKKPNGKYYGGQGYKNLWSNIKKAFGEMETKNTALTQAEGGFWKATKKSICNIPSEFSSAWTSTAGKGVLSRLGSIGGVIAKRFPLIFGAWMVYDEGKKLWEAAKDGQLNAGEVAKSGSKLITATLGAAIGQALIPIPLVGGIIGFMGGQFLSELVIGKSYADQKQEILAKAGQTTNPTGGTFDTGSTNPLEYNQADAYMAQQLQMAMMQNPNIFAQPNPYMTTPYGV